MISRTWPAQKKVANKGSINRTSIIARSRSLLYKFSGLTFETRKGWSDITDDLDEVGPQSLARDTGVGALQFSVAEYRSGTRPNISPADLGKMFETYSEQQHLFINYSHAENANGFAIGGTSTTKERVVSAWYLTDGINVALITYVSLVPDDKETQNELIDVQEIIMTASFVNRVV